MAELNIATSGALLEAGHGQLQWGLLVKDSLLE